MNKLFIGVAALGLFAVASFAIGQAVPVPTVANVGTSDVFQDVVGGQPAAQNKYATAAQIAGVPGYVNGGAVLTAFTFTFGNSQTDYFVQPAGTLATGVLTTAPNPGDGQRECFLSTQTQTSLTLTANTGQTVANGSGIAVTALTPACWTFSAATSTWYKSP